MNMHWLLRILASAVMRRVGYAIAAALVAWLGLSGKAHATCARGMMPYYYNGTGDYTGYTSSGASQKQACVNLARVVFSPFYVPFGADPVLPATFTQSGTNFCYTYNAANDRCLARFGAYNSACTSGGTVVLNAALRSSGSSGSGGGCDDGEYGGPTTTTTVTVTQVINTTSTVTVTNTVTAGISTTTLTISLEDDDMTTVCSGGSGSGTCTVTHVIEITTPFFNLTPDNGAEIAGAILAIWALAWGIRAVRKALNTDGNSTSTQEEN